jgi:hypothetical protein
MGYVTGYAQVFDAMVALHQGQIDEALKPMAPVPQALRRWSDGAWRQWYAAVWAETAVLADLPDRRERLELARFVVGRNPVMTAIGAAPRRSDARRPPSSPVQVGQTAWATAPPAMSTRSRTGPSGRR